MNILCKLGMHKLEIDGEKKFCKRKKCNFMANVVKFEIKNIIKRPDFWKDVFIDPNTDPDIISWKKAKMVKIAENRAVLAKYREIPLITPENELVYEIRNLTNVFRKKFDERPKYLKELSND